jgi:hypothetical protein
LVGAVGMEFASLLSKSNEENGVAPPPHSNWYQLVPKWNLRPTLQRNDLARSRVQAPGHAAAD